MADEQGWREYSTRTNIVLPEGADRPTGVVVEVFETLVESTGEAETTTRTVILRQEIPIPESPVE